MALPAAEQSAVDRFRGFQTDGFGYFLLQSTRPQSIGYALTLTASFAEGEVIMSTAKGMALAEFIVFAARTMPNHCTK